MDEHYSVTFSNVNHTVARPTEGQLKWALLNQKRVAWKVRRCVQHLHMRPESKNDIEQVTNNSHQKVDDTYDANNSERSNQSKIRISEGRRAMLFDSNLEYEHRQRLIAVDGFRYHRSTSDDEESDQSTNDDELVNEEFERNSQVSIRSDNKISIPSTVRRKKFRRRRRKFQPRCSDPERVQRFKEAFQVALHSLEIATAVQNGRYRITSDVKTSAALGATPEMKRGKWIRPDTDVSDELMNLAETFNIYGCSTVPKRQPSVHNPAITPGTAPLDRGATWLNLLHTSQSKNTDRSPWRFTNRGPVSVMGTPETPNENRDDRYCTSSTTGSRQHSILTPAVRQHVANVAREIFSGDRERSHIQTSSGTTAHNSSIGSESSPPTYNLDTIERDVTSFVNQFEEHLLLGSDTMIDCDDSVSSSTSSLLRNSHFDPLVPIPGGGCKSRSTGSIIPVVTYDSDERDHIAWNESTICKHLDDTFTVQELDSSFHFWNVPSSLEISTAVAQPMDRTPLLDGTTIITDKERRDEQDDASTTNILCHPKRFDTKVPSYINSDGQFVGDILELSPLNLKHFVRLLPDININRADEINLLDKMEQRSTSSIDLLVTDHRFKDDTCSKTTPQQQPMFQHMVKNDERRMTSNSTHHIIRTTANIMIPYRPQSSPPQQQQQQYYQRSRMVPQLQQQTVSAGCGLYTEGSSGCCGPPCNDIDSTSIAWKRRWML